MTSGRSYRVATAVVAVALAAWPAVAAPQRAIARELPLSEALPQVLASARASGMLELLGLTQSNAGRATAERTVLVRELGWDALLALQPGAPVANALAGEPRVLVAVELDGQPRGAITLARRSGAWKVVGWGEAVRTRALDLAGAWNASPGSTVELLVAPALRVELVLTRRAGQATVEPVHPASAARAGVKRGDTLEVGVHALASYARELQARHGAEIDRGRYVH